MLEPIPVSALEHYSYCPRQCALIHVEQVFEENVFTERGHLAHRRPDRHGDAERDIRFALPIWSDRLGLIGRADAVEFSSSGVMPIEYKVGIMRRWVHEEYQLCAQAFCLEEMLGVTIDSGAIFYRGSQRRRPVSFGPRLRRETEALVQKVRLALQEPCLPAPVSDRRCPRCSLRMACLPEAVSGRRAWGQWRSGLYRSGGADAGS